ncbi:MAG TPA: IPTL-CTERM sorting domain-containing protein [Thermoanaerobaculia bacterium]|nr:IPTL-CTERM sorting domain-containing protein [Thermoanaerobaculia bacterium]
MVLIHAQNPRVKLPDSITQVDYRFTNVGPIEITSEQIIPPSGGRGPASPVIPVLSPWGLGVFILLLVVFGTLLLRRRDAPGAS